MTPEQMKSELDRANGLLVEKLGKQPFLRLDMTLHDSGRWSVAGAYIDERMRERVAGNLADTPAEAFANIFAVLNAMPDSDTKAKHDWHKKLGDVIDEGHDLNLPSDVLQPLRDSSKAMHKNLLAAPEKTA